MPEKDFLEEDKDFDNDDQYQDEYDDDFLDDDFGGGFGGGGTPALKKHNDLLKELTNFDPFIQRTVNFWVGRVWSPEKQKYEFNPKTIKPILSQQGANYCIGIIDKYARGNNIITTIGPDAYINIVSDVIEQTWITLGSEDWFGYGNRPLTNSELWRVCNEIEHCVELVLMGATGGKYNDVLTKTTNRAESVVIRDDGNNRRQQPQSSSFWKDIKGAL